MELAGVRFGARYPRLMGHDHLNAVLHPRRAAGRPARSPSFPSSGLHPSWPTARWRRRSPSAPSSRSSTAAPASATCRSRTPPTCPVLLFEGEEVLGAKQNRTFDSSVLVDARSHLHVPVSCVEQGRWTPGREADPMVPAPQAADPALRRLKRETANRSARGGAAARADQGEVWGDVRSRLSQHGVESSSGAMNDLYEGRRDRSERSGRLRSTTIRASSARWRRLGRAAGAWTW